VRLSGSTRFRSLLLFLSGPRREGGLRPRVLYLLPVLACKFELIFFNTASSSLLSRLYIVSPGEYLATPKLEVILPTVGKSAASTILLNLSAFRMV